MRISDWSSDVCSSDLFSTVHLPTSSLTAELPQLITSLSSLPLNLLLVSLTCLIPRALESSLAPLLPRSEEHTSELQSLMRISYAVFCLKKKKIKHTKKHITTCTTPRTNNKHTR